MLSTSLYRKVYERLKDEIHRGAFPIRESVFETQLAERLGVSRTPVREAVRMLETEGLLERMSGGGFRAHAVSPRDIQDASDARVVLEMHTARLAAQRIVDAQVGELEDALRRAEVAIRSGLLGDVMVQNERFHVLIARTTGSRLLETLVIRVYDYLKAHRVLEALAARGDISALLPAVHHEHVRIFDAIRQREPELAEALMHDHLEEVGQRYAVSLSLLDSSGTGLVNT